MFANKNIGIDIAFANLDRISLQDVVKELEQIQDCLKPVCSTPISKDYWLSSGTKKCPDFTTNAATIKDSENLTEIRCIRSEGSTAISHKSLFECKLENKREFKDNDIKLNSEIKNSGINCVLLNYEKRDNEIDNNCAYYHRNKLKSCQKQKDDINNKTILRSIRRFYLNLYKYHNPRHIRKRFKNVSSSELYKGIRDLLQTYIMPNVLSSNFLNEYSYISVNDENEDFKSLVIFLFRFIGFKPKDKVKYSDDIEQKGQKIQSCIYNYSHPKMLKILEIPEFHFIFKYAYDFHLDSILNNDMTLQSSRRKFRTAFDRMNNSLIMRSTR